MLLLSLSAVRLSACPLSGVRLSVVRRPLSAVRCCCSRNRFVVGVQLIVLNANVCRLLFACCMLHVAVAPIDDFESDGGIEESNLNLNPNPNRFRINKD